VALAACAELLSDGGGPAGLGEVEGEMNQRRGYEQRGALPLACLKRAIPSRRMTESRRVA